MVSPVLNESFYPGHYLVSEANGFRSREQGLIKNPGGAALTLQAGLVLSTLDADGSFYPFDGAGSDGSQTASCILFASVVVPAGGQVRVVVTARDAEVNAAELQWDATPNAATRAAALATLRSTKSIVAR